MLPARDKFGRHVVAMHTDNTVAFDQLHFKKRQLLLKVILEYLTLYQDITSDYSFQSGVAKRFDPRAEFATTWPLEGRMRCD